MSSKECPGCGCKVTLKDNYCPYCGCAINKTIKDELSSTASDIGNSINNGINQVRKSEFNVGIFILLLIFFWPIAIIYLILT
ncbi:MAG: hypothetical protein IJF65_06940, partial [Clostridia bacterium]|nr:hypothetical protein [Clostridia bacterium]